jgi:hypothetical protein
MLAGDSFRAQEAADGLCFQRVADDHEAYRVHEHVNLAERTPWMDVAPDGRVFYSGPDQTMRKLDPAGGGSWQSFGLRDGINRSYGSHAVFDIGKTLVAGGGGSSKTALVIDSNGATPEVTATSPMAFGRRQHNLTLLADGSVLATGGNSTGASLIA